MKSKQQLTEKQQAAVDFFKNHKKLFGRYPTFAEVGAALRIAPAVVRSRILLAEKKGVKLDRYKLNNKKES
jgi:SOS-response transcriptional repressor LexA